ncbi:hypothetical protein RSAG8_07549, partial [Rhizoctonia solani AG-8 WAC10335]
MASLEDYDEFGNYIGADLDSDDEDEIDAPQTHAQPSHEEPTLEGFNDEPSNALMELDDAPRHQAVVLHEDKKYYPTAQEVYGPDVETLGLPETRFDKRFLLDMMSHPEMIRNVAVVGHLHHGKTSLIDMLVFETHKMVWDSDKQLRYTDTHPLAAERQISLKANSMSLVLPNSRGKSHLVHLLDTPGHMNFVDEAASAMRLADGVVLVVDIVEGVMVGTEAVIRHALAENLPIVLVLNKIDRLILELRLPPADAYFKIKHTIEEVNTFIAWYQPRPLSSTFTRARKRGVCEYRDGLVFHDSLVCANEWEGVDAEEFARRLWGDVYFDESSRKFGRKAGTDAKRSFVHFILEPVYKIYSQVLSADREDLKSTLAGLGIVLKSVMYKMDSRPLLKAVVDQFFGPAVGLVDMLVEWIPSAAEGTAAKVERTYTGPLNTPTALAMLACNNTAKAPTIVQITKLLPAKDAQSFRALGRVMSGVVKKGMPIRVLGEGFSAEDEEDMWKGDLGDVWINEARYNIPADEVPAGNIVMLGGIDSSITKTATLVAPPSEESENDYENDDAFIFRPIKHMTQSVLKVAVEPISPSELPKMLSGLRSVNKSYPLLHTKVEESGEHVIVGTGELYLDCVLHDLRRVFAEIEIKVSDPVTRFAETVVETSALKCYAETPNKKNKITMIAEPLERGLAEDIEGGKITMRMAPKDRGKILQERYQWDLLASRAVWAFGPEEQGPNVLLDDTLPSQVDKKMLGTVKEHIKQGFQWGAREGPLCDEPIRNVKFRILDATLAQEPIFRGGGQIVPTARRVCYSSFLMATPRLMEPIFYVEVQAPADCISAVYTVLARRRGHVTQDIPKAGSPLYTIKALIPAIDANGFETDLRTATQGQAFCLQMFDHWSIVPGDPTDASIMLRPLEPATGQALARDLVLKTRRRKGLGDQIAVSKYLDDEFVLALSASGHADLLG